MHLYISVSYFVCAVSHTLTQAVKASSGTTSIHYQSPFTLNGIQIRILLTRKRRAYTQLLYHTVECACGCDVSACAAGNKRIGSESACGPGRSCEKSSNFDHWPVNLCVFTIKIKIIAFTPADDIVCLFSVHARLPL